MVCTALINVDKQEYPTERLGNCSLNTLPEPAVGRHWVSAAAVACVRRVCVRVCVTECVVSIITRVCVSAGVCVSVPVCAVRLCQCVCTHGCSSVDSRILRIPHVKTKTFS